MNQLIIWSHETIIINVNKREQCIHGNYWALLYMGDVLCLWEAGNRSDPYSDTTCVNASYTISISFGVGKAFELSLLLLA